MTEKSRLLHLNVGGKKFDTYLSTFEPVSLLYRRLASSDIGFREHNGRIFIDRDPKSFAVFLRVLRGGSELTLEERLTANKEFEFWASETTLPVSFPIKGTVYRVQWDGHAYDLPVSIVDKHLPGLTAKLSAVCRRSADGCIDLADPVTNYSTGGSIYQHFSAVLHLIRHVQDPSWIMSAKDWHYLHEILGLTERFDVRVIDWDDFPGLDLYADEYNLTATLRPDAVRVEYTLALSDGVNCEAAPRLHKRWPPALPDGLAFKNPDDDLVPPTGPSQTFPLCWCWG
jgi:hypothetical protein